MTMRKLAWTLCGAAGLWSILAISTNTYAQTTNDQVAAADLATLRQAFDRPGPEARMRCYWWWLNGHTDKQTITSDLEQMKAKNFAGVLLVDADGSGQEGNEQVTPGPTFASPGWVALYTHALREADRLNLEITLNINSGWNLGGPGVTPEQSSKILTWSRTDAQGGPIKLSLPSPASANGFYREIAILAYPMHAGRHPVAKPGLLAERSAAAEAGFSMPDSDWMLDPNGTHPRSRNTPAQRDSMPAPTDAALAEVRNLTRSLGADGILRTTLPPGIWEILRIGYTDSDARVSTSSGAWQGRAIDHMSRAAFDAYWDRVVEPLLTAAKPFHSLRYLATDSWELGGTNWTFDFREQFRKRRGYDPVAWLPAVAGRTLDSPEATTRFLADLRRTVGDLVTENHFDRFAERAAAHGLGVQAESGGPHGAPVDALETFRNSAVPQTEFWSENHHRERDQDRFFTKEAASAANIYGRRFVAQEGETDVGPQWSESLGRNLKPSFDMAVTEGMNRIIWHAFVSSPADTGLPGQQYFAGTHLNPKVTWWNAGNALFNYMDRIDSVMQQGIAVDDVLYFPGDNVPSFVRLKADDPAGVGPGFDYDVTDQDALLRTIRADGHELVGPSGVRWRALAMPHSGRLSLAALDQVTSWVRSGVIVFGARPLSPTGQVSKTEAARFDELVREFWGPTCDPAPRTIGQGRVFCSTNGRAVLKAHGDKPDVELVDEPGVMAAQSKTSFDYAHRRLPGADVYFLRSGAAAAAQHSIAFRVAGKSAELWNPVTGERFHIMVTPTEDGRSLLHLTLAAFGSAFIVFTPNQEPLPAMVSSERVEPLKPIGSWTIRFEPGRGAPQGSLPLQTLRSWTESSVPGVRYFSGTATYQADIVSPNAALGETVSVRFGNLHEIARIKVNGHEAGTIWSDPLQLRVDQWLHSGTNHLEVEVTNLWPNRIIGDLQQGATEHFTQTNIRAFHADSPLLPSGIEGPVEWVLGR